MDIHSTLLKTINRITKIQVWLKQNIWNWVTNTVNPHRCKMTNVLLVTTLPMEVIQGKKLKTLFHHLPMTTFNDFCFFFKQYMITIDLQDMPAWYKEKVYPPNKVGSCFYVYLILFFF